ncbi:putative nuclease HARBI1 [Chionoecetes opilio]|uniref:Putative nuclease HARBI1 n=1 Tax=Chionoecetes opilio TaxID=41210 RepID=A0A8J4XVV8_CHIOP|nr:putative nuclease HARBI1 [Chionoecetes opilio]
MEHVVMWQCGTIIWGLRISPSLQLLVSLRYLATGNFQLTPADTADMSQASVSRCIKKVVHAIAEVAPRYIRLPTPAEEGGGLSCKPSPSLQACQGALAAWMALSSLSEVLVEKKQNYTVAARASMPTT